MHMNKELLIKHSAAFPVNPDAAPLFPSSTHQQAVDSLVQGLRRGHRIQYLSGGAGCGKSAVLMHFKKEMTSLRTVYISHSFMDGIDDYIRRIFRELELSEPAQSVLSDEELFSELRLQLMDTGNPLLIVDDTEGMDADSLQTLDTLSLQVSLPIIFSGDCDFVQLAAEFDTEKTRCENRVYYINTLNRTDTARYIQHRLNAFDIAEAIFSTDAIDAIYEYSAGNPRLINLLCNNCIILMGVNDDTCIRETLVHEVARNKQASGIYPFTAHPPPEPAAEPEPPQADEAAPDQSSFAAPHPGYVRQRPVSARRPESRPHGRAKRRTHGPQHREPVVTEPYISDNPESEPYIVPEARHSRRGRKEKRGLPWLRAAVIAAVAIAGGSFVYERDPTLVQTTVNDLAYRARELYSSGSSVVRTAVYSVSGRPQPMVRPRDSASADDGNEATARTAGADIARFTTINEDRRIESQLQGKADRLERLESRISTLSQQLDDFLARQDETPANRQPASAQAPAEPTKPEAPPAAGEPAEGRTAEATEATETTEAAETNRSLTGRQKRRLVRNYLERASYELERDQPERAHATIARGLEIAPYNRALLELRRQAHLAE